MQGEPRRLALGRLTIHGESLAFEPEASTTFSLVPGERVELLVPYGYREVSRAEEVVRVAMWAELGGSKLGPDEREIRDAPMRVDDRRSFLALPIPALPEGEHKGRFGVMARYSRGDWNAPHKEEWLLEREGVFTLRVGARVHRV